ncbi:ABC transporter permease [Subtercola vilae]|uniref:ABC-2 type transporter transmembrane domain-containing protein n=1 Tax=Subtercola vilae TaxID=2056433 RepID=A0A4T2B895_9MICO|nr:ABC transporter permease [Subtercola vilae]TIH27057.1 hypothetical protein D4765_18740 [Subtercola vilae]
MVDAILDYSGELRFHFSQLLKNSYFLQLALIPPAVFVALRLMAGATDAATVWADGTAAGIWTTSVAAVGIIGFQRAQGTLEYLVGSPRPLAWTLSPLAISCSILGLLSIPVTALIVGVARGGLFVAQPLWYAVSIVLTLIACSVSALCLSGLFVITRHAIVYEPVLVAPILLLSGAVLPYDRLGQPWQSIALLHPLTGAVALLQESADGTSLSVFWIAQVCVTAILLVVVARMILRAAEKHVRVDGTLHLS